MTFRCLAAQFYPDGGHVEETPAYQASAADAFLENYHLAALNGRTYWTKNRRRLLVNTIESLYQLIGPSGDLPGLSDTYRSSNPRPFLSRAGYILGEPRYLLATATLDDVFLLGNRVLGDQQASFANPPSNRGGSFALPDAGYYMMRGADVNGGGPGQTANRSQVIVDAGPKGGTHGHYDLLSFEYWGGLHAPLVPDPGPYRYDDSADRAYVVSTRAHNTISIDGLNHGAVEGPHDPRIVVDAFDATAGEARFTAHHHAYEYLAGRPTVGRTIWVDRSNASVDLMIAVDWGRSGSAHTFTTSFNLLAAADAVARVVPGVYDAQVAKTNRLRVQSLPVAGQEVSAVRAFVSSEPPPDAKEPATRVDVAQTGTSAVFVTLFSRYVVSKETGVVVTPPASAEFESPPVPGQPVRVRLTMPDGSTKSLTFVPPDLTPLDVF
jgi:hypothetical protein